MANLQDYKNTINIVKVMDKIERMKREIVTVNYGDYCPIQEDNDCANCRRAFDYGFVSGLQEALEMLGIIDSNG